MKFNSLATRLTFWYAGVFSCCFLAVFGAFYILMHHNLHRWTDSELKKEVVEVNVAYSDDGMHGIVQQFKQEQASGSGRYLGRLLDSHDSIVYEATSGSLNRVPVNKQNVERARAGDQVFEIFELGEKEAVSVIYSHISGGPVIQIGLALQDHEIWLRRFSKDLLKVALLALFLSVSAGGFMARRTLWPLRRMAETASSIPGPSMGQRMQVTGRGDEVDRLAESFKIGRAHV
jgi:hypothetical protein